MNVRKFNDFLNEDIQIPVLDVVIDDNGNVYNGMIDGFPLTKGNIVRDRVDRKITVTSIISNNGTTYPAGIDKNGNIVTPSGKVDEEGFVLNSRGERMRIPQSTYALSNKFQNKFWKKYKSKDKPDILNYSFLVPIVPTGWVNVKIDMEVLKRVRRYSRNLGTNTKKFESFKDKLTDYRR